ncbi:TPA: hypothetical protein QC364_000773 [Bacillus cereus]|uniref:hypothetical protein n=1 Tax=Bacillus paranthracis TaxID=2026186 RepID=UPI002D76AD8D|nr:hypothetical protein [Bacillus paranthracis]HDR8453981.1 hypothetical protein [Bacillus cereus]
MKFGQRYKGRGEVSPLADYVQFDISGLSAIEIVQNYFILDINNKPILLLGDYSDEEKGSSEDDMLKADRIYEIKDAISSLRAFGAEIMGITIYPFSREGLYSLSRTIKFDDFIFKLKEIYDIPVLVRNSNKKDLFLSTSEEIIRFSQKNKIAISPMSLYEALDYDLDKYLDTVLNINLENIQEIQIRTTSCCMNECESNYDNNQEHTLFRLKDFYKKLKIVPWFTLMLMGSGGSGKSFELSVKKITDRFED